jgi:hypothetical protein
VVKEEEAEDASAALTIPPPYAIFPKKKDRNEGDNLDMPPNSVLRSKAMAAGTIQTNHLTQ